MNSVFVGTSSTEGQKKHSLPVLSYFNDKFYILIDENANFYDFNGFRGLNSWFFLLIRAGLGNYSNAQLIQSRQTDNFRPTIIKVHDVKPRIIKVYDAKPRK